MKGEGRPWARAGAEVLLAAVPLVLLAVVGTPEPLLELGVIGGAALAAVVVRHRGSVYGPLLAAVPLLAALAFVSDTVALGSATEVLAGVAGIGVVAWIAVSDGAPARLAGVVEGVLVPGLGLGIALSVSILLPVARQSIGIATVLLVATLGLLAWAILSTAPEPTASDAVPPSL